MNKSAIKNANAQLLHDIDTDLMQKYEMASKNKPANRRL